MAKANGLDSESASPSGKSSAESSGKNSAKGERQDLEHVVIRFAGDSGDGMFPTAADRH